MLIVSKGLAVNRAGQTLRLECEQRVALIRQPDPTAADECVFNDCDPKTDGVTLASGTGFYVLLIAPASKSEGKAPVSGLGNSLALCNSQYLTEGVKFRLLKLNVSPGTETNKIRNMVAYQCFGVPGLTSNDFVQNALTQTPVPNYGVEALVPTGYLTTSDVPLAIIEWNTAGLGFVDQWSVRRRISKAPLASFAEPLIGDRRLAEGEARLFQFQEHIESLRETLTDPSGLQARQSFSYLPSVGFVPLTAATFANGFDTESFFEGLTVRGPCFIEGSQVASLVHLSMDYPPIDLSSNVLVWLYRVREKGQEIDQGVINAGADYVIFATGHIPPRSAARFDVSHWSYSNYTIY